MNRTALPSPAVFVLDADQHLCADLTKLLQPCAKDAKIVCFSKPEEAREAIETQAFETCVMVTDSIGVLPTQASAVHHLRRAFPRMKVVFHSRGASDELVRELMSQGVMDRFIRKSRADELVAAVTEHYSAYWENAVLRKLRSLICDCQSPAHPCFPGGTSGRMSILDVYWEIVRGTALGVECEEAVNWAFQQTSFENVGGGLIPPFRIDMDRKSQFQEYVRRQTIASILQGGDENTRSLDRIRTVSGEAFGQGFQADVVLLTATQVERDSVLRKMRPLARRRHILKVHNLQHTFYLGNFGKFVAVLSMCEIGAIGRNAAIITTLDAITRWRPLAVIMVGIAFGKDKAMQRIGDVLVADRVIAYEPERVGEEEQIHRGAVASTGAILLNRFRNATNWKFAGSDGVNCRIHIGPVVSGEKLVDSNAFKKALVDRFPNAVGGDMEAVGVYVGSARTNTEWIVVKGICDWADGTKNKEHQPFAAAAAVDLVHAVLSEPTALNGLNR